jgi:DivIVA domain-containing protein
MPPAPSPRRPLGALGRGLATFGRRRYRPGIASPKKPQRRRSTPSTKPPESATIDAIRYAAFPTSWGWRGYDKAEVEKFLDSLADWLEAGGADGARAQTQPAPRPEPAETTPEEAAVFETMEHTIEHLEHEIANAKRREKRLADSLEEAREKIDAGGTREAPARRKPARPRPSSKRGATKARRATSGRRKRRVDINEATFVELRGVGLGVSGAARLLALREIRGEFTSLDVLEELELPASTVTKVRSRLYIDGESSG